VSPEVVRGEPYEACFDSGETGAVGTVSLMVIDNDGAVFFSATTTDIVESPAGSGVYCANRTAPDILGHYSLVWSLDGTYDPASIGIEDLFVVAATVTVPALPALSGDSLSGPCSAWTTAEDVFACCSADDVASDPDMYNDAVDAASQLLYELSGRQFLGTCQKTVRPCNTGCGCNWQVLSRGYVVWGGDRWSCDGVACGCSPASRILLSGEPVRSIIEVKIDGVAISPDEYRLDQYRYLTRKNGGQWPSCQDITVDDTEEGSFSVEYTYGKDPPLAGQSAAAELACEIYQACDSGFEGDCVLPTGVSSITRQGITIERNAFASWGRDFGGTWRTGLPLTDLFLNAYNPTGQRRRTTFMTPGRRAYPLNT
jgi:hypothetical protein